MERIEERVKDYWTKRAPDFAAVRRMELEGEITVRWLEEIEKYLPGEKRLKILDAGTGTGYFTILLSRRGHEVWGIDLTPAMIEEAKELAAEKEAAVRFLVMDAQSLEFPDQSFDVVIARNLTWTLPEPEKAYREWLRVLKKGGILLNFDADYGKEVSLRKKDGNPEEFKSSGFHQGMTRKLQEESNQITMSMKISEKRRPEWDVSFFHKEGYENCFCDRTAGERILKEHNGKEAPLFLITVSK